MAFTSEIKGRMLMPPSNKRYPESGTIEKVWGVWDGTGVTTGNIVLECDNVLMCNAIDASATPGAIQIEVDQPSAGSVRLTFTSGHAGRFEALVKHV